MSYKLMEFGGQATVILRAICDFEVNGIQYTKDDVVLLLDDVPLNFTYNEKMSDVRVGKQNQLFYDERRIDTIIVGETQLTSDYLQLFCKKISNTYIRSHIETIQITDKTMYLTNKITNDNIYILDHGKYTVEINTEYNSATLNVEEFPDGEYDVLYQEELIQATYDVNSTCSLPYLNMEVIGQGNIDKQTGNIYFSIPKVSLLSRPEFSLNNLITSQNLIFKVIQDTIKVSM